MSTIKELQLKVFQIWSKEDLTPKTKRKLSPGLLKEYHKASSSRSQEVLKKLIDQYETTGTKLNKSGNSVRATKIHVKEQKIEHTPVVINRINKNGKTTLTATTNHNIKNGKTALSYYDRKPMLIKLRDQLVASGVKKPFMVYALTGEGKRVPVQKTAMTLNDLQKMIDSADHNYTIEFRYDLSTTASVTATY